MRGNAKPGLTSPLGKENRPAKMGQAKDSASRAQEPVQALRAEQWLAAVHGGGEAQEETTHDELTVLNDQAWGDALGIESGVDMDRLMEGLLGLDNDEVDLLS